MEQKEMPILAFREKILDSVKESLVTIINAATGVGKTTQVPQMLIEAGYYVLVTQPRRLACKNVAIRVADEIHEEVGNSIGYHIPGGRAFSRATKCLFLTESIALIKALMDEQHYDVLILDEVHEMTLSMEILLAWAKIKLTEKPNFRLVVMSATLEKDDLGEYFEGKARKITVPGKMYPVRTLPPGPSIEADATKQLQAGRNVLVFQPSVADINETIHYLERVPDLDVVILPLHGTMEKQDQDRCFETYDKPKCIVSTNIAETSLTIPDIDVVIDSGMERHVEVMLGVETLRYHPISQADGIQRKGRAGRTQSGIYIDHYNSVKFPNRPEYPKAEILCRRLDQTVLRLLEAGIDAENVNFFHQPDISAIQSAKKSLKALGMVDSTGRVTELGFKAASMPVSVQHARMIIEADKLGVVEDVIIIAAILEANGILDYRNALAARSFSIERNSDLLYQLEVFKKVKKLLDNEMRNNGIHVKRCRLVRNLISQLHDELLRTQVVSKIDSTGNRTHILQSIYAGMVEHVYNRGFRSNYIDSQGFHRKIDRDSVVNSFQPFIVGFPYDIEYKSNRSGDMIPLHLLHHVSVVDIDIMLRIAPHLVEVKEGIDLHYQPYYDAVTSTTHTFFNGILARTDSVQYTNHPLKAQLKKTHQKLEKQRAYLYGYGRPRI